MYWVPNAYYSTPVCLSNRLLLETISQFVIKWADLFIFRTNFQNEFKLEIWFRDGIQTLQVNCHYRWAWEERNPQLTIFSQTGAESFKQLDLWKYSGTRLRPSLSYLEAFFIVCTISTDNRASSDWRCLHGVGGHVSPATVLTWAICCCWDWSSSAEAHHPEGTGIVHQTSKGDDAAFCIERNPVQVNESESWEVQAARKLCVSLVYAGISWQRTVLLLKKLAFASGHSQFSGLSHVLLFFLFCGNFCPCLHSISWEIYKIRGRDQAILFTALHLHGRREHQYICMTSTLF